MKITGTSYTPADAASTPRSRRSILSQSADRRTSLGWTVVEQAVPEHYTASDFNGLIATINKAANKQAYYDLFDTDKNGTITSAELGNSLLYNSTAGNPNGQVNYYRIWMSQTGAQDTETRGWSYFAQDDFSMNRFTFNVGLRAEKWMHYATTGAKVFSFDTTLGSSPERVV